MKSVIQQDKKCFICGRSSGLEEHHIFGGPNRKLSEQDGLKVWLCYECHRTGRYAVHTNRPTMDWLHKVGQEAYEKRHKPGDFLKRYGKNYL